MPSLANKRVVVTRQRQQSPAFEALLKSHGAHPIAFPTIEIVPPTDTRELDEALLNLSNYDWFILTSTNGVEAVWERFAVLGVDRISDKVKVAAIGPKTAQALQQRGCQADFVPQEFILEEIVPGLDPIEGTQVLMARGDKARSVLPETIRAKGGQADDLIAYRTLPAIPDPKAIAAIQMGVDLVAFTSPSTIENFANLAGSVDLMIINLPGNPAFPYIGPVTAQKAQELGLPQDIIAKEYTIEGLVTAILEYYARKETHKV